MAFIPTSSCQFNLSNNALRTAFSLIILLALGQASAVAQTGFQSSTLPSSAIKTIATQARGFGVPFKINAEDESYIEVQLFVSTDQGQSWQYHGRQATDAVEFPFQAPSDGEYWFALKTLDRDRQLIPQGKIQPELKIIVDTVKPSLVFSTDTDQAGRIICNWEARDADIEPKSLTISYRSPGDQQWRRAPFQIGHQLQPGLLKDQIAWWPESSGTTLEVRCEVADRAGNQVAESRTVRVPEVAWRNRSTATAFPGSWQKKSSQRAPTGLPQHQVATKQRNPFAFQTAARQQVPPPVSKQAVTGDSRMICENGQCRMMTENEFYLASKTKSENNIRPNVFQQASTSMVGSEEEWDVPPPIPDGLTRLASMESQTEPSDPAGEEPGKSITWESQPSGTAIDTQTTIASTFPAQAPKRLEEIRSELKDVDTTQVRELPGGLVVSESTASRKKGWQPMAQLDVGKPWQGRGVANEAVANQPPTSLPSQQTSQPLQPASTSNAGKLASNQNLNTPNQSSGDWLNEKYQPNPDSMTGPVKGANASPDRVPPNRSTDTTPTQPVGYGTVDKAPHAPRLDQDLSGLQTINKKRFNLDYGIDAIDSSGVKKVVLWMTRDGGHNWKSWSTDPDAVSPMPVEVDEQGMYGFRIVVHSKEGLTGLAPKRGDKPDIVIRVDNQAPNARIVSVPYGKGDEAGRLVINWEVDDPHLALRPVTLAYASDRNGQWTTIEHGLRNSGRYVWKVGPQVPEQVYLRLEARDEAGNVGVFQLKQKIDISGLVPRGRIRGVQPAT